MFINLAGLPIKLLAPKTLNALYLNYSLWNYTNILSTSVPSPNKLFIFIPLTWNSISSNVLKYKIFLAITSPKAPSNYIALSY